MRELGLLRDLLILFGLGIAVVIIVTRVRIPVIVGFLLTGIAVGPHGLGLIRGVDDVEAIAEIGVVLLLFTVGIEFSMQQLLRVRAFLIAGGGLQVGLTLGATTAVARLVGLTWSVAFFLGMLIALSSTAIVLRLLAERGEADTPHGRAALGILIFQDLCIVPMMLLTPILAGNGGSAAAAGPVVLKALAFLVGALVAARVVVPWLLRVVVGTRRREIFLLTIVFLCLGAAWVAAQVGLSLALGAFIAGLVISESEFSQQALGEILPLREVFNSLFFLSIGMLFDLRSVLAEPFLAAAALAGTVLVKSVITAGVTFALGQSLRISILTGLALAQIGEFSFVLSKAGLDAGLLDERLEQLFLAVAVGSMAITPLLHSIAPRVAALVERRSPATWSTSRSLQLRERSDSDQRKSDHVIIVGYGLNGRNVASVLAREQIPFSVVEMNPDLVRDVRAAGQSVMYGDASHAEVLEHAGGRHARVIVIAISDAAATRSIVATARRLNPSAAIVVRTRYVVEIAPLVALGAHEVVPEEFETSIEICSRVLRRYLVPRNMIEQAVSQVRQNTYDTLRNLTDAAPAATETVRYLSDVAFESFEIGPSSPVAGRELKRSRVRDATGAAIVAIRRGEGTILNPTGGDQLLGGDVVTVVGKPEQIRAARALFEDSSVNAKELAE